jgi:sulfate transport system permease protein
MSDALTNAVKASANLEGVTTEPKVARVRLIGISVAFLSLFMLVPLITVFSAALSQGLPGYFATFLDTDARAAIELTLMLAAVSVAANVAFGIVAAWAIGKFEFVGKNLLITLIDLPLSVSPVVSGLAYVLVFGAQGVLGPWTAAHGLKLIFAFPGMAMATTFVTFPFVARELIPLAEQQGSAEEEAALTLGASGFKTFLTVTLPNLKWALLYGVLLCNARAMGEFGAVSVVFPVISAVRPTRSRYSGDTLQ